MHTFGIRWTIGDVSAAGFEALRFSIQAAGRLFGSQAAYAVCVNHLSTEEAIERIGPIPFEVRWHQAESLLPTWIRQSTDAGFAEGVAWKFAPVRLFGEMHELSLDNDVILWQVPLELAYWLDAPDACLIAEDVWSCFGAFQHLCGPEPKNSGIRGLPPGLNYEAMLHDVLNECPAVLTREVDEQGFQIAAIRRSGRPLYIVSTEDVTICSPFPPHQPHLGKCGAHFVGLNTRLTNWLENGRPGHEHLRDHWDSHRPAIECLCRSAEPARAMV